MTSKRTWRIVLVLLLIGAASSFAIGFFSKSAAADIAGELFLGLLACYAGADGINSGVCLNFLNALPFVWSGPVEESESPNLYALSIFFFFLSGLFFLSHGSWRIYHAVGHGR